MPLLNFYVFIIVLISVAVGLHIVLDVVPIGSHHTPDPVKGYGEGLDDIVLIKDVLKAVDEEWMIGIYSSYIDVLLYQPS